MLLTEMWPGLSSGCIPLGSPLRWDLDGGQAQQLWALETPIVPEGLSWAEAHGASSLWGVVNESSIPARLPGSGD